MHPTRFSRHSGSTSRGQDAIDQRQRRVWVVLFVVIAAVGPTGLTVGAASGEDTSGEASNAASVAAVTPVRELPELRTAASNTFLLSDGSFQAHVYDSPVNYPDGEGDWKPIDEDLEAASSGGLTNAANSFDLQLPEQMGSGAVRVSEDGQWASYRLLGPETEAVEAAGATATYEAQSGDVAFELHSLADGLKEEITLDNLSAPHLYRFEFLFSAGLQPVLNEDGSIGIENQGGDLFATLPAPTISDSGGGLSGPADAVHYSLTEGSEAGRWIVVVEADAGWLSDPQRSFPVTIDPSVTVAATNQDCTMGSTPLPKGWSGCGSTGATELLAAYSQKENQPVRTFLRFNLNHVVPSNAYVSKAVLGLYAPSAAENTPGLETRRVTKPWTTGLNWEKFSSNKQDLWTTPGGDFTSEGQAQVLTSQRGSAAGPWNFESESLRTLVAGWTSGSIANEGLVVKQTNETKAECEANPANCNRRWVSFRSTATTPAETRPKLTINYYPAAPKSSKITSPWEGIVTARRLKLQAAWTEAGVTGVTFQYREGKKGPFETIPAGLVRDAENKSVSWPMAVSGAHESKLLFFDAAHVTATLRKKGGTVQVRALFDAVAGSPAYGVSKPVEATVDRFIGGPTDASAQIGPGNVDLLTGNLTVSRTDISIPAFKDALEFSRSFNSRGVDLSKVQEHGESPYEREMKSPLGPGWKPGVPVEEAGGGEWLSVSLVEESETNEEGETNTFEYAHLTSLEGEVISFKKEGENFLTPPELTGWSLKKNGSGQFVLSTPEGTVTTFSNGSGGSEYLPISVAQTGGTGNKTQMEYDVVGGRRRLKLVIAPTPSGTTCTSANVTTNVGCKSLKFNYTTFGYGDRLTSIQYYGAGSSGMTISEVAKYAYDPEGRLKEASDPRSSLKETYTYDTGGQIHTITPPGQEPWTLEYGVADEEEANGRLVAVKRPSLVANPATAQTTIAYGVPLSTTPYDLSAATIAKWGQTDIPVDATAIFPPDQIPSSPPSSYSRATVYYMDFEGMTVNTATAPGAGTSAPSITTTETDEFGNVVREHSAQNRLRALEAGTESAAKSKLLDTQRQYYANGTEMREEWGPLHKVKIEETGETEEARMHRTVQYALASEHGLTLEPHLPTTETTGASIPGQAIDSDQRFTQIDYDWSLLKPTKTIVDPTINGEIGLDITTRTIYDPASGLPVEQRQPSNTGGGGAGTTKTVYYKYGHGQECEAEVYAGLPCKVMPAAQPGTAGQPELPVRRYLSYNQLGAPLEIKESPGGGTSNVRKTVITYDAAGRQTSKKIEGGGADIPKTETLYGPNGLPTTERFCAAECGISDTQALTTTYDNLGRVSSYEDADGNKATTTYDLLGRPISVADGKGSQTLRYDITTGLLTELEDSAAGLFTASYDADGDLVKRGLPNGLTAETTFDETGSPVHLTYTKSTSCGVSCTWMEFALENSIRGQILSETSNLDSQSYSYDRAGRLVEARETPQGGQCTTRAYTYDLDSNRKTMATRSPGVGGFCTTSGGTIKSYAYDAADRLVDEGIAYDSFGRITKLPAADAGGKELTTSYFSNDMVATQSQGGVTNTFELDGSMRQRQRLQGGGGLEGVEVFHYDGPGDSPSWTQRGSVWTRSIVGIGGELVATQESGPGIRFALTDLHGDVVASASASPSATELVATYRFDEFGNQTSSGAPGRFGWLGGEQRRTELPSGVLQMGARSYVPQVGRFISPDPIEGGSANRYDYGNQDPIGSIDASGLTPHARVDDGVCSGGLHVWSPDSHNGRDSYGAFYARLFVRCETTHHNLEVRSFRVQYEKGVGSGDIVREFEVSPHGSSLDEPVAWSNWQSSQPPLKWDCRLGQEYQVLIRVTYQVGMQKVREFVMPAQEECGHGPY